MTHQQAITLLATWLREEVCANLRYKVATVYKVAQDAGYEYELAAPAVYETYFPRGAAEREPKVANRPVMAPCIIVTISGQSTLATQDGMLSLPFRLLLQTWNPGSHAVDEDGKPCFRVDAEGWRDVASFADVVAKAIAEAECPGGLAVTDDILTTLPEASENDFYPYYRAEIAFTASAARRITSKYGI